MSKQIARRTSDRVVEQYGENIGDRVGCVIEAITDAQADDLRALFAAPNGGVIANADGSFTALPPPAPPPAPTLSTREQQAVDRLRATFGTARTAAQVNVCIDDLAVLMRRVYRELE